MPAGKVISDLLGSTDNGFHGSTWPEDLQLFTSNPDWFRTLASMSVFCDPEEWLDRAPELLSFGSKEILARSDARRRYREGESIYIIGLDRAVKPLRELCAGLAADLALSPSYVTIEAWSAGGPTSVAMHYDHDYNFNLQVAGRKQWQTARNDLVANPISHQQTRGGPHIAVESGRVLPTDMPADARTWEAGPGDVVYLPRGTWHATRTTEATFAMAFVVKPPTWAHHVTNTLLDRLHADPQWRQRVLGGRDLTRHAALNANAAEALSAAKALLDQIGPTEVLYPSLWGRKSPYLKRKDDVVDSRVDEPSGTLTWRQGDARRDFDVPPWARAAAAYMASAPGSFAMARLHDLVGADDVPLLRMLIAQLSEAGFLELAPTAVGGVAPLPAAQFPPRPD